MTAVADQQRAPLGGVASSLRRADLVRRHGRVSNLIGLIIEATGLLAEVGEVCLIAAARDRPPVAAEVVGFRDGRTLLMPLGELQGIGPGTKVQSTGAPFRVPVGNSLLGRVLDGLGRPIDIAGEVPAQAAPGVSHVHQVEIRRRALPRRRWWYPVGCSRRGPRWRRRRIRSGGRGSMRG